MAIAPFLLAKCRNIFITQLCKRLSFLRKQGSTVKQEHMLILCIRYRSPDVCTMDPRLREDDSFLLQLSYQIILIIKNIQGNYEHIRNNGLLCLLEKKAFILQHQYIM